MSAQNDTNLDNDTAQDLLCVLSTRLSSTILSLLEHPDVHDSEDEPIGQLFAWIEVFFALHAARLLTAVPDAAHIKRLTDAFLPSWEASLIRVGLTVPSVRKASIISTFEKLNAICKSRADSAIIWRKVDAGEGLPADLKSVLDMLNGTM